jgi:hypothetical protein
MMKPKDYAMYILGALVTICFFTVLAFLIFRPMPIENKEVLYLAIGALIGFEGAIVNYFFGSSAGSAAKTQLMAASAAKNEENANAIKLADIAAKNGNK